MINYRLKVIIPFLSYSFYLIECSKQLSAMVDINILKKKSYFHSSFVTIYLLSGVLKYSLHLRVVQKKTTSLKPRITAMTMILISSHTSHSNPIIHSGKMGRPVVNTMDNLTVYFGLSLIQILDVDESNQVLKSSMWYHYVCTNSFLHSFVF